MKNIHTQWTRYMQIKTEAYKPLVRRANPNNMRYENSQSTQGRQHIYSAIYAISGWQHNPVVSRTTIVQQDVPLCISDKIGFNKHRMKLVDLKIKVQPDNHYIQHCSSSRFKINRYREAVRLDRLDRFLILTGWPRITSGTSRAVPVLVQYAIALHHTTGAAVCVRPGVLSFASSRRRCAGAPRTWLSCDKGVPCHEQCFVHNTWNSLTANCETGSCTPALSASRSICRRAIPVNRDVAHLSHWDCRTGLPGHIHKRDVMEPPGRRSGIRY